jgi:hypothetical protein
MLLFFVKLYYPYKKSRYIEIWGWGIEKGISISMSVKLLG